MIIYINDSPKAAANCEAILVSFSKAEKARPFIVSKRLIFKNEEITYSYGDKDYEWRKVRSSIRTQINLHYRIIIFIKGFKQRNSVTPF